MVEQRDVPKRGPEQEQNLPDDLGLGDLDALLANAEAAEEAALAEERTSIEDERHHKAGSIAFATALQEQLAQMQPTDGLSFYDAAWLAYEEQKRMARPEGVTKLIEAIGKTGSFLDRSRRVPQTAELAEQIQKIQQQHNALFTKLKTYTIATLEQMKEQFGGEQTEIEQRLAGLHGPLAVGVRVEQGDTPEGREKRLKQEIVELMMGEFVSGIITQEQEELEKGKQLIAEARELRGQLEATANPDYTLQSKVREFYSRISYEYASGELKSSYVLREFITRKENEVVVLEKQTRNDQIVATVNRTIIEDTLAEEHDPEALRATLQGLRHIINEARTNAQDDRPNDQNRFYLPFASTIEKIQKLSSHPPVVLELLQRYKQFGASRVLNGAHHSRQNFSPIEQLAPQQKEDTDKGAYRLKNSLEADGIRTNLDAEKTQHFLTIKEAYEATVPFNERGQWNNVRKPKPDGWQETVSGASVAPGVDPNTVEKDYQRLLEKFSAVRTEGNVLDLNNPDGSFEIYTMDGANRIILQMRRDTFRGLQQATEAGKAAEQRAAAAERIVAQRDQEIATLKNKQAELQRQLTEKDNALTAREAELSKAEERFKTHTDQISAAWEQRVAGIREDAEAKYTQPITDAVAQLEDALEARVPILGGEPKVRNAASAAVEALKKALPKPRQ